MPNIVTNEVWEIRIVSSTSTQVAVNTVRLRCNVHSGTGATDQQLANAFDASINAEYKAVISGQAAYRGISAQRIFPTPRTAAAIAIGSAGVGGVSGDLLPSQVSGIISLKTEFAGPKYRGRIYIPFPGEPSNSLAARPESAYVGALQTLADAIFTPFSIGSGGNTSDLVPVIFHRVSNTTTEVAQAIASTLWATQRRRGDFGRLNSLPF